MTLPPTLTDLARRAGETAAAHERARERVRAANAHDPAGHVVHLVDAHPRLFWPNRGEALGRPLYTWQPGAAAWERLCVELHKRIAEKHAEFLAGLDNVREQLSADQVSHTDVVFERRLTR